jgi:hypothetical protein
MKKLIISGILFTLALFTVNAQGFYLDFDFGIGLTENEIGGRRMGAFDSEADRPVELGINVGFSSFKIEHMPVYMTLSFGALGHRFEDACAGFEFNTYLIGTGFVAYPFTFIQIAGSFGYSFILNDTSKSIFEPFDSEFGLGYTLSAALKLSRRPSGFLIGAKYFWTANIMENSRAKQVSSGVFAFAKYSFRQTERRR